MAYEPWKATFGVGTRVKVIKQFKYPDQKLLGLEGTVRSDTGTQIAVVLDAVKNQRSAFGCFYFKPSELLAVDEFVTENMEEKNMNVITNYLNIAKVRPVHALGNHIYECANFESDLKVDDFCVITTDDNGFLVAQVAEIVDNNDTKMKREVVIKVYTDEYDNRVKCRTKAAELKAKMEARAKQLQDIALYKMLAETDPDMAALLDEYQAIPKM